MTLGVDREKMVYAANMMSMNVASKFINRQFKIGARTYEILRREVGKQLSVKMLGVKKSEEHKAKISCSHLGKIKSSEHRASLSKAQKARIKNGTFANPWSGERGSKMSTAANLKRSAEGTNPWAGELGSKNSKAICAKMISEGRHPFQDKKKASLRAKKRIEQGTHPFLHMQKLTCHCGKTGSAPNMRRWHLLNCKISGERMP